ncbi:MAG: tyrosine-type recombinase/integrase [Ferruginibacter sp.]
MSQTQQLIQSYLGHLKYQKRYSRHTLISYQNDLSAFFDFALIQFDVQNCAEIKAPFIRSWLASLKEKDISTKTINRKISSLKSFFKYLLREDVITLNPVTTIITPKISRRLPQYVEKAHMETLFSHVTFSEGWKGKTERLIMELLYNTGMRQAELIGLKKHNIDISNSSVKILGKGNKERIIPISNALMVSIKEYMTDRNAPEIAEPTYLLVNENGRKLYPKYVYRVVKNYLSYITTIDKKSPHILRHTFATHLTNNGADLNAVKELLGHSSLAATQIYTHNSIEKLKDIHKKAHPKG